VNEILTKPLTRDGGHANLGHHFLDKHDAAADFTIGKTPDVKPKVHFVEALMKRHGHAEEFRIVKLKSNNADVRVAIPNVEFGSVRHKWREGVRIDRIIEHHQVTPRRGEERAHDIIPDQYPLPAQIHDALTGIRAGD
jgi:hypothetical protein